MYRQFSDIGKNYSRQHVESVVLGNLLPILRRKPFFSDGLKGVGLFLSGLDSLLGHVLPQYLQFP